MTGSQAGKIMALLAASYPAKEASKATIAVYMQFLAPLPFDRVLQAAYEHIGTSTWFPTIAELLAALHLGYHERQNLLEVMGVRKPHEPLTADAWAALAEQGFDLPPARRLKQLEAG